MVMNEEGKQKYDDYYYSKAERDRNRIIEIVAKSRKPIFLYQIKEIRDEKVWFYESQLLGNESELEKECKSISGKI